MGLDDLFENFFGRRRREGHHKGDSGHYGGDGRDDRYRRYPGGPAPVARVVVCQSCGAENPERAKFCLECGTALRPQTVNCAQCAAEMPARAKFCPNCGAPHSQGASGAGGARFASEK